MLRTLLAVSVGATFFLSGCATQRTDQATSQTTAKTEAVAAPATPPVKLPASASRKVVLIMTGPKNVVEARDWAAFKQEWRDTFAEHAKESGIGFAFADNETQQARREDGTLVRVTVNDYRMVGIGARVFLGVMTGNAYIDARVQFVSLRDGSVFGEQRHNTSSSAWGGVFAKVTPQQVNAIATDVFNDVKAARQ
jgi:hypothetical protein